MVTIVVAWWSSPATCAGSVFCHQLVQILHLHLWQLSPITCICLLFLCQMAHLITNVQKHGGVLCNLHCVVMVVCLCVCMHMCACVRVCMCVWMQHWVAVVYIHVTEVRPVGKVCRGR